MRNEHGFTLIELLAVIVVLAIITLITTPIVINIINSSKNFANKVSASNFAKEANKYAIEQKINGIIASGNIFDEVSKRMDGKKPEIGVVYSDGNGNIALALVFDNRCYTKEYNSEEIKKVDINECYAPVDFLALGNKDDDKEATFFNGPIKKSSVEKIVFVDNTNVPTDAIGNWNASASGEGKVVAWYKDEDNNNLYEVYIGGEGGVKANPNSYQLFNVFSNLTSIDLRYLDTSSVTSMQAMFRLCSSLTILDVSKFDTSKVTNMYAMFQWSNTTTLDVSKFDTSKVEGMDYTFMNVKAKELDVSNWDTSNVTDMAGMFGGTRATILDVSNFDTSKVTNMYNMFGYTWATTIYASDKFITDNVTESTNMFNNATKLISGNGTKYDSSHIDKEYARIDTTENPGYFTLKEN